MLKTLLISSDAQLADHVGQALHKLEFEMDLKPTLPDGMDKMRYERYCALLLDRAAGDPQAMDTSREQWLKRDPVVVAIGGQPARSFDGVPGADTVWTVPLMPWEVYRTLLNIRTREVGDRRLRKRFTPARSTTLRYSYDGEHFSEATIVDITETGVAIAGFETFAAGQALQLQFKLPAMLSPIQTLADVVWCADRRAGLRFLQMPQQQHKQLERWLERSRRGMATGYSYASGY